VLLLAAVLLLLTLLFPEEGTLFGRLAFTIRQIGGWAVWLAVPALVFAGTRLLRHAPTTTPRTPAERWEPLLIIFVLTFPAIHILTQATFDEAHQGGAAGLLGWALAEPLLIFLGRVLTSLFYLGLLALALAMWRGVTLDDLIRSLIYASGRLRHWAEELAQDPDELSARTVVPEEEDTDPAGRELVAARIRPKAPRPARAHLPPLDLLERGIHRVLPQADIDRAIATIEQTLTDFGLVGAVTEVRQGPSVTQYGVEPGYINRHDAAGDLVRQQKVRISQIANLRADFALALAVSRLRIEAPVPGRGIVGIEVPNMDRAGVRVRDVLDSSAFRTLDAPLGIALGQDVSGSAVAIDLAKMPHLLIAGTTGSGKSVCIKTIITSLIVNNTPDTLQLVLIDPKRVEMLRFNGLPHLLGPVEVEGERIIGVLRWVVSEMERRYALFATANARNLVAWNRMEGHDPLPRLVVLIDELADLMGQFGAETERTLCRLAQMARATGIHLVVATQRPSTDVITGLIKANFPARIAFAVASGTDSRVVLDTGGAEQLLGNGDMLFLSPEASVPMRVQGSFVEDEELERLLAFWEQEIPPPETPPDPPWQAMLVRMKVIEDTDDELEKAIALCQKYDTISASLIQRRLRVGYPRAARIMESLYEMGLVEDPKTGGKTRKSYVSADQEDPLGDWIGQEGQAEESADSDPDPDSDPGA
jgi:S-DNA-T family DNA segregation ATPase FtsK/SpoIIIE